MSKNNDLTKGPITKSIMLLSIPLLLTSFLEMAYSFIDMIWIAKLSSDAVSAVGTAGFFLWLGFTLTQFVTVGMQTRSAQEIGEKNDEQAKAYQKTGIQLIFTMSIIFATIIFVTAPSLISFFAIDDVEINRAAVDYLKVGCFFIPSQFINFAFTRIFNSKGISKTPFLINLVGSIVNIVMDPILIFGMFGFDAMGVTGAGVATLLGNYTATIIFVIYILKNYEFLEFGLYKKFDTKIAKEIISISFAPGLYSMFFCVVSMLVTRIVSGFGSDVIAVQKVGSQLESISWNTATSLSIAISAFIAQNYGAKEFERIKKGYNATLIICVAIGAFATVLFTFFPHIILLPFFQEEELIMLGVEYFKILALSQIFQCVGIMTTGAFNGLGVTKPGSIIGIVCNGLRVPVAYYLSSKIGVNGIWWAITMSTIVMAIILFLLYKRHEIKLSIRKAKKFFDNPKKA